MFECHSCKRPCKRLIAAKETLACENCYVNTDRRPTFLHQKAEGAGRSNFTVAKDMEINERVRSKEDPNVFVNRRTKRPTQY